MRNAKEFLNGEFYLFKSKTSVETIFHDLFTTITEGISPLVSLLFDYGQKFSNPINRITCYIFMIAPFFKSQL